MGKGRFFPVLQHNVDPQASRVSNHPSTHHCRGIINLCVNSAKLKVIKGGKEPVSRFPQNVNAFQREKGPQGLSDCFTPSLLSVSHHVFLTISKAAQSQKRSVSSRRPLARFVHRIIRIGPQRPLQCATVQGRLGTSALW